MNYISKIFTLSQVVLYDAFARTNSRVNIDSGLRDAAGWLCRAQDSTPDGGVSEGYHLKHGWLPSYPETTGYIIETFFDCSYLFNDPSLRDRALRMVDWLISIQYEDGSIPDSYFKKKMVFDTGQVLFGFVRAFEETREQRYLDAAVKAGSWLVDVQEQNGTWQKHAVGEIPHSYYTRVAWSLIDLYKNTGDEQYRESCKKNIEWALAQQLQNGWFKHASFTKAKHTHPFTHTIAYTIRGILESGMYLKNEEFIDAACKAIESILSVIPENGGIYGSFNKNWQGNPRFSCLTGNAQLGIIFFKLYQLTNKEQYLDAGRKINNYMLSKQVKRIKNKNISGAIAGSSPIWGEYIHFMYPNWAAKFFIDSLLFEKKIIA